jgi:hypothetical protein
VVAAGLASAPLQYSFVALMKPPGVVSVQPLTGSLLGGTLITITGTGFNSIAAVRLVELLDASLHPTGRVLSCAWDAAGSTGTMCNDTAILCLAPSNADGTGYRFSIQVSVGGSLASYAGGLWRYFAPAVLSITPVSLPPLPLQDQTIYIVGREFGTVVGVLAVDGRAAIVLSWSNTQVSCRAPRGVRSSAPVIVIAASTMSSNMGPGNTVALSYRPPVVLGVSHGCSPTSGGGAIVITGNDFNAMHMDADRYSSISSGSIGVSVWLSKNSAAMPSPPWSALGVATATSRLLSCRVDASMASPCFNASCISCVLPSAAGRQWSIVVVNHDTVDASVWQSSPASSSSSSFFIDYDSPVLIGITASDDTSWFASGGFTISVTGSNFGPFPPVVTIGGRPCSVVPGSTSHTSLQCVAPARDYSQQGVEAVVVQLDDSSNGLAVLYDSPLVTAVMPAVVSAVPLNDGEPLFISGLNFGSGKGDILAESPHVVTVGSVNCTNVQWVSDNCLTCAPLLERLLVGSHVVTVSLRNISTRASINVTSHPSRSMVAVRAECPVGYYGREGEHCETCPIGAVCRGGLSDPVSMPGYYPRARTQFLLCQPPDACAGDANATVLTVSGSAVACSRNYAGDRCASCAVGSYRLNGTCRTCPNTAWLLFFLLSLVIIASVAVAVYFSERRVNFAVLSIGVVCLIV